MDSIIKHYFNKYRGLGQLPPIIEGKIEGGEKVVVLEDLISTAKSSIAAIDILKEANCDILGLSAIFTYDFDLADQNLKAINCPYITLSDYPTLIQLAVDQNYVEQSEVDSLQNWRKNPKEWSVAAK